MKIISLLLLLFFSHSAQSATYYFSAASGDDSRNPEEAQNPATPWKSLSKLNSFFSSLQPGDQVLLKRNETFYGSIIVNKSGTVGAPIIVGAYGAGDKPVITSLITLSDWVSKGNGIWESHNLTLPSKINMLVLDGAEQELGRYPNSDAGNKGYLDLESHIGTASIIDSDFTSKINWTGAELVLRSRRWVLDRNLITNYSGHKISYRTTSIYAPYDKQGYFFQNDIKTLDKFGEWYYNSSVQKISIFSKKNNPAAYTVQVPTADNTISSNRFSNIVFNNLNITGSNLNGFNIKSGSNISIQDCDINFSGQNGVKVTSHTSFSIINSTVSNSNNNGIDLGYNGDNAVIRNNKIINTARFPGLVGVGDGKGIAIFTNGNGNIIEYNQIKNTGYTAINFNGNNVTIKNNLIDSFCLIKDDGGGIYCAMNSSATAFGRKITGNIIINGIGAGEGTNNAPYLPAEGIYLDNNAANIEMLDNTIANCNNNGIYIHNSYGMTLNNNTIYNNAKQLNVVEDPDNSRVRNCIFTNNIFSSKLPFQVVSNIRASAADIKLFGNFNNNYYSRPLNDRLGIFSSYVNRDSFRVNQNFDLQGWQNQFGQDKDSKITAVQVQPYKLNKLVGSNKIDNGTFTSSMDGATATLCTLVWSHSGLLDGGYMEVRPDARNSSVYLSVGSLKAGKNYILRYSVRGSIDSSMTIKTFLRQDTGISLNLTPLQSRKVSVTRSNNELLFSPLTDESSASLVFKVDDQNKFYLDNIQLFEADATITNPDDSIRFEYNASVANKTISLEGSYIDVKSKKYSNSIKLAPYTSVILIKDNQKNNSSGNQAPTVSITNPDNGKNFNGSDTIKIAADASDKDGTVAKVEFYKDTALLATKLSAPYTYSWNNAPDGTYSITAKATDNDGAVSSDVIEIKIASSNEAPVVRLIKPETNTNYTGPATIKINADASDNNGTVTKVEFYNGSRLLHTEYKWPYNYSWMNVPDGTYSITAKATDNDGLVSVSDTVKVTVGKVNGAPVVSIVTPKLNDNFNAAATISMAANAFDKDSSISKVEFYSGSTLLHTENELPYTYAWEGVTPGDYQIVAVATDNDGNVTTSDIVPVSVGGSNALASRPGFANNAIVAGSNNQSLSLKLSPDPARNILNVATAGFKQDEKITISIVSSLGTLMKTIQPGAAVNQMVQVDVSSLTNGIYFVKVVSGNNVLNQKFVKL